MMVLIWCLSALRQLPKIGKPSAGLQVIFVGPVTAQQCESFYFGRQPVVTRRKEDVQAQNGLGFALTYTYMEMWFHRSSGSILQAPRPVLTSLLACRSIDVGDVVNEDLPRTARPIFG